MDVDKSDDVLARFMDVEFQRWREASVDADRTELSLFGGKDKDLARLEVWQAGAVHTPARQFVLDLALVLGLKGQMTRRQWVSTLESLVRLGAASHVMWLCFANDMFLCECERILDGGPAPSAAEFGAMLSNYSFWRYGQRSEDVVRGLARDFLIARLGINLILEYCEETNAAWTEALTSVEAMARFLSHLAEVRDAFPMATYRNTMDTIGDDNAGALATQSGIGKNVKEFVRHALGQRQTSEPGLDSYDQGYFLRKSGVHRGAPWVVGIGPVAAILLVHCECMSMIGTRNIQNLCCHLRRYGFDVQARDITDSELGITLRNLGLIYDSPDAEGGMVISSPFMSSGEGGLL